MKLGDPIYVVVRMSKYLIRVDIGMVVGMDNETGQVCYSVDGIVHFANVTTCYGTLNQAEAKKQELERQT